MHELSIVLNIIDIAEKEAARAGSAVINRIELDIGELSTIERTAFDFAWKQGIRRSMLDKADCVINYIPGKGKCRECGAVFRMDELYEPCPDCGSYFADITEGKELKIKSIVVD